MLPFILLNTMKNNTCQMLPFHFAEHNEKERLSVALQYHCTEHFTRIFNMKIALGLQTLCIFVILLSLLVTIYQEIFPVNTYL
jgi:hypothetical protein